MYFALKNLITFFGIVDVERVYRPAGPCPRTTIKVVPTLRK